MFNIWKCKRLFIALFILIVGSASAVHSSDDIFTGAEFLKWSERGQNSFANNSLLMAIYVISQSDKAYAECVTQWFNAEKDAGFPDVRATIADHAESDPQLIMLALVERECGSLNFGGRD